jgi:hypothetical protein
MPVVSALERFFDYLPFTQLSLWHRLYRYDLQRIGYTNEQKDLLTDMDMLKIAQKMQLLYLQSVFFTHVATEVSEVFTEKENTTNRNT